MADGDRTKAAALNLARAHLEKMGWKYSHQKIGETAAEILNALHKSSEGK